MPIKTPPEREFASFAMLKKSDNDTNFPAVLAAGFRDNLKVEYGFDIAAAMNIRGQ